MQDQPATESPLLGPAAVLGRNRAVPNNTGQGQRQKVVPTFVTFLVPTEDEHCRPHREHWSGNCTGSHKRTDFLSKSFAVSTDQHAPLI